jgi:hypothetical protein
MWVIPFHLVLGIGKRTEKFHVNNVTSIKKMEMVLSGTVVQGTREGVNWAT